MSKSLPSDPFESLEDEIFSLNFGIQDDISLKDSEVDFHRFMSQICEEYNLEATLQQYPEFFGTNVYTSFTSLFSEAFDLDEDLYKKLYFINRSLYIYTIYMDDVADEDEPPKVEACFFVSLLRDRAYALLHDLFPKSSDFWTFAKKYQHRVITATLQERTKWHNPTSYSLDEAFIIASGRASTAQMITTALACLSDSRELICPFEKSLDAFFTGILFRDDLKDWRVDFMAGRYSYLLSQIIQRKGLHKKLESISLEELGRMIYFTGLAEEILDQTIDYYQQALSYVDNVSCTEWKIVIDDSISETAIMLRNLKKAKAQEIDRIMKLITKKEKF
ncbi:MAG: hypothetical protein F4Y39_16455 [Gemmatimonadetes bacterium]|nr:hypothetical protein [Gemmatimonadota bacterium]